MYLFTDLDKLNKEQRNICTMLNIHLNDVNNELIDIRLSSFKSFNRWPKIVFLNYYIPYLFSNKYDYAIKLDYDILCVGKYNINSIIPNKNEILSAVYRTYLDNNVEINDYKKIAKEYKFKYDECRGSLKTINAGFFVVNINDYINNYFFEKYTDIYSYFEKNKIKTKGDFSEQIILGFMQGILGIKYKKLGIAYNFRPAGCNLDDVATQKLAKCIKNIHYSTACKPWLSLDINELLSKDTQRQGLSWYRNFLFFNNWIHAANILDFKLFKYRNKEYTIYDYYYIYTQIKKQNDMQKQRINILLKILEILIYKHNLHFNVYKNASYAQLHISSDKLVHYEISVKKSIIFSIHFEGKWKYESIILDDICKKNIDINFNNNYMQGQIFIEIPLNFDIINITEMMIHVINRTKRKLKMFILYENGIKIFEHIFRVIVNFVKTRKLYQK